MILINIIDYYPAKREGKTLFTHFLHSNYLMIFITLI